MIAWIRFAMERSGSRIAAIASSAALSASSLLAAAFLSLRVSFIAASSSADNNPFWALPLEVVRLADFCVAFLVLLAGLMKISLHLNGINGECPELYAHSPC